MAELVLTFIVKIAGLALCYYLVHNIFSKRTKSFHLSASQSGIEVDSTFYEEQFFIINSFIIVSRVGEYHHQSRVCTPITGSTYLYSTKPAICINPTQPHANVIHHYILSKYYQESPF